MIFKTIEDDASDLGFKLTNVFSNAFDEIEKNSKGIQFSDDFRKKLKNDREALKKFSDDLANNVDRSVALSQMQASINAKAFAENWDKDSTIEKFTKQQIKAQVSLEASKKSIGSLKAVISQFNQGFDSLGISQEEYIESVKKTNQHLGNYLAKTDVGKAKLRYYGLSLAGVTVKTIALNAAKMALNATMSMGISLIVSGMVKAIYNLVTAESQLAQQVADTTATYNQEMNSLRSTKQEIDQLAPKYAKLSKGVNALGENVSLSAEEYEEYNQVVNRIADISPELVTGWTNEGNAILAMRDNVDALTESWRESARAANDAMIANAAATEKDFKNKSKKLLANPKYGDLNYSAAKSVKDILSSDNLEASIREFLAGENYWKGTHKALANYFGSQGLDFDNSIKDTFEQHVDYLVRGFQEFRVDIEAAASEQLRQADSDSSSMRGTIMAYLENAFLGDEYSNISDRFQNLARNIVSGLSFDDLQQIPDASKYVTDLLSTFNQLSSSDQDSIVAVFDIQTRYNNGDCSIEEYLSAIDQAQRAVANIADAGVRKQIDFALNIDTEDFYSKYNYLKKYLLNNDITHADADEFIHQLNNQDFEIAVSIVWEQNPERIQEELKRLQEGGNVDLTNRAVISTDELRAKEWEVAAENDATVYTQTFANELGNQAVNLTPIEYLADGSHNILTEQELSDYAKDLFAGKEDTRNLRIGIVYEGNNAVDRAKKDAERIHELHQMILEQPEEFNLDWLLNEIRDYQVLVEEPIKISDLFADDQKYYGMIDDYVTKTGKLGEALEKIRKGEFTEADQMSLLEDFQGTDFADYLNGDNWEEAITNYLASLKGFKDELGKESTGIFKIFDEMRSMIDPEDTASLSTINMLEGVVLSLADTADKTTPSFDKLSDAIGSIPEAAELYKNIQKEFKAGEGFSPDTIQKATETFGQDFWRLFTIEDGVFKTTQEQIEGMKEYLVDYLTNISTLPENLSEADLDQAVTNWLDEAIAGIEKAIPVFENLEDAMNGIPDAAELYKSLMADLEQGSLSVESIMSAQKMLGDDFWKFFTIEDGEFKTTEAQLEAMKQYFMDAIMSIEGLPENIDMSSLTASMERLWDVTISGAQESKTAIEKLTESFDKLSSIQDFITEMDSGDLGIVDAIGEAISLLENLPEGTKLTDIISISGDDFSINTQFLNNELEKQLDLIAELAELKGDEAKAFKDSAKKKSEEERVLTKWSDTMGKASDASSLLSQAQEEITESGKNSISTLQELMDMFGADAMNMYTFTPDGLIIDQETVKSKMYQEIDKVFGANSAIGSTIKKELEIEIQTTSFDEQLDGFVSKTKTLKEALETLKTGDLDEADYFDLLREFPELSAYTDNLAEGIKNLLDLNVEEIATVFDIQIKLADTDEKKEQLEELKEAALELADIDSIELVVDIEAEKAGLEALKTAMEEARSATGLTQESIDALQNRYKGLATIEDMFIRTSNGIYLNSRAVNDLEEQYLSLEKQKIDAQLEALIDAYDGTDAAILDQIYDLQLLQSQYDGLISKYNQWQKAQASANSRDPFENVGKSIESIENLISDGWATSDDVTSWMELVTGKDYSGEDATKIRDDFYKIKELIGDFYTFDKNGDLTNKGIFNFFDLVEKEMPEFVKTLDDGSKYYDLTGDNILKLAEKLGLSAEFIELIARAAEDAGFKVDWDNKFGVDNIDKALENAEKNLQKLNKDTLVLPINFELESGTEEFEQQNKQIEEQINNLKKQLEEDPDNAQAQALLDYYTAAFNKLNPQPIDEILTEKAKSDLQMLYEMDGKAITINAQFNVDKTQVSQLDSEVSKQRNANIVALVYDGQVNALNQDVENMPDAEISTNVIRDQFDGLKSEVENGLNTTITVTLNPEDPLGEIKQYAAHRDSNTNPDRTPNNNDGVINNPVRSGTASYGLGSQGKFEDPLENVEDKEVTLEVEVEGQDDLDLMIETIDNLTDHQYEVEAETFGQEELDKMAETHKSITDLHAKVQAEVFGVEDLRILKSEISTVKEKEVRVGANVFGIDEVNALVDAINNLQDKTVTVGAKTSKSGGGGSKSSNGDIDTPVIGTAFSQGNWGAKNSGKALVGELGQEILVRNGKFYTIGDDSPEFINYKKGDIIFNHVQSEQILKYGKIIHGQKRAHAIASGTAFATGNAFDNGSFGASNNGVYEAYSSISSGSASKNKKSSKKNKDKEEWFDWIEIAIDRIERAIDNLELKATSAFKTWGERTSNLRKQMSLVTDEIDLQKRAYDRYIEEANNVGLDAHYAKLVRNGAIDIEKITDEDLIEDIKNYQEWYEKALDCAYAVDELNESLSELYQQNFDNVTKQFEDMISLIEHEKNLLEESISQSEEQGYIVSVKYYEALIESGQKNIDKLYEQRAEMQKALSEAIASGTVKQYSEAWYEMSGDINDVTMSIEEAKTEMIEYNNSIRDIEWEIFDLLQEKIGHVIEETEFLVDLLSNEKLHEDSGQLTGEGLAIMGMHGMAYNTYMEQAKRYAKELQEIEKDIANDPNNKDLLERRQELLEAQRDSILAAQDERQEIVNLVEEGIDLELEALEKRIDKYNESLDAAKDLYDYQKKIQESTKEIASLEKQMMAYQGDDSEETKKRIQELKVSLEEARSNLEETEYDHYIEDTEKMLDDLYTEYEELLNMRLDDVDMLIKDMIDEINSNSDSINQTLEGLAEKFGFELSNILKNSWSGDGNTVTVYDSDIMNSITNATTLLSDELQSIDDGIWEMVNTFDKIANSNISTVPSKTTGYASGAYRISKNQLAWTQEGRNLEAIIRPSDGAILTPLARNDSVLNAHATANLFDFANNPSKFIKENLDLDKMSANVEPKTFVGNTYDNDFAIQIDLPNVTSYGQFVYELQHDPSFERMIKAMTIDKMFGGSSMNKYRY